MQKEKVNLKKSEKIESGNKTNKLNSQQDKYSLYLKTITENVKNLQKFYNTHLSIKGKTSKENINSYFSQIFSTINILSEEKDKIISKYESIIIKNEEKIRILYSDIFNLQIKNTFLENNLDILLKKEKEYRLVKEKTGVLVENGKIVYNTRKENEIFILRTENSTLKNVITKNEIELKEMKEKLNTEKDIYDKKVSNLNLRIDQLKSKLKQIKPKFKGQSYSCTNINTNDTSKNNLRLNFTVNNSTNKGNNIKALFSGINYSNNNEISYIKKSNIGIKRKYDSILNKKYMKSEKNSNSIGKTIGLSHWKSTGILKIKKKSIKKINQEETTPNTFHKELNLSNINVSPIHNKKILCLTPQNNNNNCGLNFQTFQKIIDNKKKNNTKIIHKNYKIIKNCLSNQNINKPKNSNRLKVLFNGKNNNVKNNKNLKNSQKMIKKELTWSKNLLDNSSIRCTNYKIKKASKINVNNNNKKINNIKSAKSPHSNIQKNKRTCNIIANMVGKEHITNNKTSLSSVRGKNTVNNSINSYNKNIFNSHHGNNLFI